MEVILIMMQPDPESMGIFTGFKIDYPVYTVVLPQTGVTFNVRGLTVAEVSKLKTSMTTPAKSTDLINNLLWKCLEDKPKGYDTFEGFMKGITLKDREALIYAMYVTTFGDEREFNTACNNCGAERVLRLKLSDMFSITPYEGTTAMLKTYQVERDSQGLIPDPVMEEVVMTKKMEEATEKENEEENEDENDASDEEDNSKSTKAAKRGKGKKRDANTSELNILSAEIKVHLPVSNVNAIVHQPKLIDEYKIMNEISFAKKKEIELVNETLIIKRFEVLDPKTKDVKMYVKEREDILRGYQSLPNIDRKRISEEYLNTFAQYGVELKSAWNCLECDNENTLDLDIVRLFFRMVTAS